MGAEKERKGGIVNEQRSAAITKSFPNCPYSTTATTIRGRADGIVKLIEDCWKKEWLLEGIGRLNPRRKPENIHITQPPSLLLRTLRTRRLCPQCY
jgi:hypothetical protein